MNVTFRDRATFGNQQCSRRRFLQASSSAFAGLASLAAPTLAAAEFAHADAAIQIVLCGGPSQIDTWDPKPSAPSTIRGPFRPIRTTIPGLHVSELFPQMARRADQFAIVRSLVQDVAPVHELGLEVIEARCEAMPRVNAVRLGCGASLSERGLAVPGRRNDDPALQRYGRTEFGRNCQEAVHLVQAGTRFIEIQMFPFPLYDTLTWDCHANEADLPTTLDDYRTTICPMFDQTVSALIDDLATRGLLQKTLVVCAGEFGRSPKLNPRGGRDHWTGVFSAIFAGGGVRGGQVIGSSDRHGGEPRDLPLAAGQIPATILHALGIAAPAGRDRGSSGAGTTASRPILELF